MKPSVNRELYPNLLRTYDWGKVISNFEVSHDLPPEPMVSNVNIVPFINEKCVLIQLDNGNWEMLGETLEPREDYLSALKRVHIHDFRSMEIHFVCGETLKTPFTLSIYYRVVGYGDVELVSAPSIPEGGEKVVAVEAMTLKEARLNFMSIGRPDLAELYEIANVLRRGGSER
jgi:8-oxo-dGTP diphosphatase